MSVIVTALATCDACGKIEEAECHSYDGYGPPMDWYCVADGDACSKECMAALEARAAEMAAERGRR